jgi:tetratricopeptide (TPR) repeat protein
MKAVPEELKVVFNRSVWLYIAAAVVFSLLVNDKQATKERSRYLLGIFYNEDLQNFRDGIVYFDYLAHHKPQEPRNYFLLGYCYAQMKDYRRAVDYFEQAIKLAPNEASYPAYLDYAKAKLADPQANVALPPGQIDIPIN